MYYNTYICHFISLLFNSTLCFIVIKYYWETVFNGGTMFHHVDAFLSIQPLSFCVFKTLSIFQYYK